MRSIKGSLIAAAITLPLLVAGAGAASAATNTPTNASGALPASSHGHCGNDDSGFFGALGLSGRDDNKDCDYNSYDDNYKDYNDAHYDKVYDNPYD